MYVNIQWNNVMYNVNYNMHYHRECPNSSVFVIVLIIQRPIDETTIILDAS